jgi:periplasmic mercuric ion binding protein
MKINSLLVALAAVAVSVSLQAETVKLTGVHNCCKKCDTGIIEAVKGAGAEAVTNKGDVTITAKDAAGAKKAIDALLAAGYSGSGAEAPAVTDAKVKSATVSGVHLCCGKCVTAAEKAILSVAGVAKHDATKGAESFKVEGDFSTSALQVALNKAGLNGSIK